MEISRLPLEAISAATSHRNQMLLPLSPGWPIICCSDVTMFLPKYKSLPAFTSTDPSSSNAVSIFPYYCVEGSDVRDMVVMMRGYMEQDSAVLRTEMFGVFWHTDSQAVSFVYKCQYLEQLCATLTDSHRGRDHPEFGGLNQMESSKWFLLTCDDISGVVTERGMMVEYERTEMLLHALPKRVWSKTITKLSFDPHKLRTFYYGKLDSLISPRTSAAKAVALCEFLAPAVAILTTLTSATAPPTSPASIYLFNSTARATSGASTTSPSMTVPPAPLAPTASTSPMAPTSSLASPCFVSSLCVFDCSNTQDSHDFFRFHDFTCFCRGFSGSLGSYSYRDYHDNFHGS